MPIELRMPALSPTMEEGTLAKWLVKVGDTISSGDIMAEIETDKATMEFEAVDEGTLAQILIEEGAENVAVGTVIAMLAEEGEDVGDVSAPTETPSPAPSADDTPAPAPTPAPAATQSSDVKATPVARRLAQAKDIDLSTVEGTGPRGKVVKADIEAAAGGGAQAPAPAPARSGDRVIASPLAKRIAGEKGIDLGEITGSGPDGRIIERDVTNFVPAPKAAESAAPTQTASKTVPEFGAPYDEE
ncbi:MAG: E3 binding domain-containing protein, partial [Pseudomonadota bacterium]